MQHNQRAVDIDRPSSMFKSAVARLRALAAFLCFITACGYANAAAVNVTGGGTLSYADTYVQAGISICGGMKAPNYLHTLTTFAYTN